MTSAAPAADHPAAPVPSSPPVRVAGVLATDFTAYAAFWALIALALTVGVTVLGAVTGDVESSVWFGASNFVRWIVFTAGIVAVTGYLPLFVAHGIARRDALTGMVPVVVGAGVVAGLVATAVLAVEAAIYGVLGWPHGSLEGPDRLLYDRTDQWVPVAVSFVLTFAAYAVTGLLAGAAYQRLGGWLGTLVLPVSFTPVVVTEALLGGWMVPGRLDALVAVPGGAATALAASAASMALGLALTHRLLRDVALDNDGIAWWR